MRVLTLGVFGAFLLASTSLTLAQQPSERAPAAAQPGAPAPAAAQAAPPGGWSCVGFVANYTLPTTPPKSGMNPLFGGVHADLIATPIPNNSPVVLGIPGSLTGSEGAGAKCRAATVASFNGVTRPSNKVWSDPAQFCAHVADKLTHYVVALEIITQVGGPVTGHTGGFNRVAGYKVNCGEPTHTPLTLGVIPIIHAP